MFVYLSSEVNNILSGFSTKRIRRTTPKLLFFCETLGAPSSGKVFGVSELNECGNYFPDR